MVPRLRVQGSLLFATPGSELVHGTVAGQEIRREKKHPQLRSVSWLWRSLAARAQTPGTLGAPGCRPIVVTGHFRVSSEAVSAKPRRGQRRDVTPRGLWPPSEMGLSLPRCPAGHSGDTAQRCGCAASLGGPRRLRFWHTSVRRSRFHFTWSFPGAKSGTSLLSAPPPRCHDCRRCSLLFPRGRSLLGWPFLPFLGPGRPPSRGRGGQEGPPPPCSAARSAQGWARVPSSRDEHGHLLPSPRPSPAPPPGSCPLPGPGVPAGSLPG